MEKSVLFIQSNSEIASHFQEIFKERFEELEITFIVSSTATEAFEIMKEREIFLLLIDINIPDMRLSQIVERCDREFPGVILNVCIDVMSPLLVTKLVNRHRIHKIFAAPWDMNEVIEEVEDSIECAQIEMSRKKRENMLIRAEEEFQETLSSLTYALKKQQYSYYKLNTITQLMLTQLRNISALDSNVLESRYTWVNEVFVMLLKMQTTGVKDIDGFEDQIRADLLPFEKNGFHLAGVISCLIGEIPKVKASNIRFVIWLLTRYYVKVMDGCELTIASEFETAVRAVFTLTFHGTVARAMPSVLEQLRDELLNAYVINTKVDMHEDTVIYQLEFLTAYQDEEI